MRKKKRQSAKSILKQLISGQSEAYLTKKKRSKKRSKKRGKK